MRVTTDYWWLSIALACHYDPRKYMHTDTYTCNTQASTEINNSSVILRRWFNYNFIWHWIWYPLVEYSGSKRWNSMQQRKFWWRVYDKCGSCVLSWIIVGLVRLIYYRRVPGKLITNWLLPKKFLILYYGHLHTYFVDDHICQYSRCNQHVGSKVWKRKFFRVTARVMTSHSFLLHWGKYSSQNSFKASQKFFHYWA